MKSNYFTYLSPLLLAGMLINNQAQANESIEQAIDLYFKGTYEADATMIRKAFHPNADVVGYFDGKYIEWTLEEFIARITSQESQQKKGEPFNKRIVSIESSDHIATIKAYAPAFGNEFTDLISLIKTDAGWKIRHKQFTNTGK